MSEPHKTRATAQPVSGAAACKLLVVGDNHTDVEQIREILAGEFAGVSSTLDAEEAIVAFEKQRPQVLVLAYRELERSEQCYLGLLRKSRCAHDHPHRVIILCGKDDAGAAFGLCKRGYFDDYVLYWPQAQDGHRLAMSVWIACREHASRAGEGLQSSELAVHVKHVKEMEDVLDAQVGEGVRHAAVAQASMARARDEFAAGEAPNEVLRALAASNEAIGPISAWARKLGSAVLPQLRAVCEVATKASGPAPLLMVVEDDAFAARLVAKALDGEPWDVVVAADASEALVLLRTRRPTAILMDINLPGIDGVMLTERLKASPTLATIPVLMVSGEAKRETLERSIKAGAAGFIVKPFTSAGLIAKLAPFVG